MAHHKSQHYVPKCYLRNFAVDDDRVSINILNLSQYKLIKSASIKDQCARSYFYGEDLVIEKALQPLEGRYANIYRLISKGELVSDDDLGFLASFCYLQYLRTDIAAQRTLAAHADMARLIQEGIDEDLSSQTMRENDVISESIKTFYSTVHMISDLKVAILINNTKMPFVTSDDPAIQINRYYSQKLGPRAGSSGLQNSGLIFMLPLSPIHCLICYDKNIYTVPDKIGCRIYLNKISDIEAINELQFLKSAYNIYFNEWSFKDRLLQQFNSCFHRRPSAWHKLHYAVRDDAGSTDNHIKYKVVHTEEERLAGGEAIMHLESVMLIPSRWLSKLRFRDKMRFIDTGTGRGFLRP
jgi:hypothetical protein